MSIIRVPSLKLATERLKKLETLQSWLHKVEWTFKKSGGSNSRMFVNREITRQRTLIKAIKKKEAILEDYYGD